MWYSKRLHSHLDFSIYSLHFWIFFEYSESSSTTTSILMFIHHEIHNFFIKCIMWIQRNFVTYQINLILQPISLKLKLHIFHHGVILKFYKYLTWGLTSQYKHHLIKQYTCVSKRILHIYSWNFLQVLLWLDLRCKWPPTLQHQVVYAVLSTGLLQLIAGPLLMPLRLNFIPTTRNIFNSSNCSNSLNSQFFWL